MISIIIFSLALAVAVFVAIRTRSKLVNDDNFAGWITKPALILVVGLIISFLQPFSLTRIDSGAVGGKANLTGDERGVTQYQYKTGWVATNEWTEQFFEYPTYQQHIEYDSVTVILKGGFAAVIKPSFNYNVLASSVGDMFVNLRLELSQIEQGWLKNAIVSSVQDVANKWTADELFNDREKFEAQIIAECNKRVSKWFNVSQLRTNIMPPQALVASINQKTKAIQDAQTEIQKAIVADAQAKVKIANAKGDSAQVVIKASGDANALLISAKAEADAMRMKQQQLSQQYIEYIRASNWDGKYWNPQTVIGSGAPLINTK